MRGFSRKAIVLVCLLMPACDACDDGPQPGDPTPTEPPSPQPESPTPHQSLEPNDQASEAVEAPIGSTFIDYMSSGDKDWYLIQVPSTYDSYKLTLSVNDEDGTCFQGVDPNLEVLASDGVTQLYWIEDAVEDYCPELSFPATPGSSYYAVIGTAYSLAGTYTLEIRAGGPGTASGQVLFESARWMAGVPSNAKRMGLPAVPDAVLVSLAPDMSSSALKAVIEAQTGQRVREVRPLGGGRVWRIALEPDLRRGPDERTRALLERVQGIPGVLIAEEDFLLEPLEVPDDAYFAEQWDFTDYPGMNVVAAWDVSQGSSSVIAGVVDTGDDPQHQDLRDKREDGFDFISDPDNADDGDGIDDNAMDNLYNGHGTHVAGTIAAMTDNGLGVAGVGWNVHYMPLRICGNFGCTGADLLEAIYYGAGLPSAAGPGLPSPRVSVMNFSIGGHDYCPALLDDAFTAAAARGVICVASAGNDGIDASEFTPASCGGVITVGSTGTSGRLSSFSNDGPALDVLAPGEQILSTIPGDSYGYKQGTSMAAPHASGLAALLKSVNPDYGFETVLELMRGALQPEDAAEILDAEDALLRAEERTEPEPPPAPLYVVRAIDVQNENLTYFTFTTDGFFTLSALPEGTYRLEAGLDADGDLIPGEADELYGQLENLLTISYKGEDFGDLEISVSME